MKVKNAYDCLLKETASEEKFAVLVGRHSQHGGASNHTIAVVELPPGGASDPHFHKEREESYFVLEGRGRAEIAGQTIPLNKGDLVSTAPGERHQFFNEGNSPFRYLVITAPAWVPEDSWK